VSISAVVLLQLSRLWLALRRGNRKQKGGVDDGHNDDAAVNRRAAIGVLVVVGLG
jgi:hypothetical protein